MCGISGFIDFNKRSSLEVLEAMNRTMEHRGPDGEGYFFENLPKCQIGFGHKRLSIIDLSHAATQPMAFNNYWITFNGEVYNYQEIRVQLEALGHSFKTHSDTEVILHAFAQWGTRCVEQFVGMFAFVIFDQSANKVYCFRDRAGVKPFYYYWQNQTFLFGSELKTFHKHPQFNKQLDTNALALFFQLGYIPVPHCIFKNAFKLRQGHYLVLDLGNQSLEEHKYWDVNDAYKRPTLNITEPEAIEETEKILTKAFNYRMVADVPVGIFLSGGYDSSAVAALLQKESTQRLKTFSIGFHEEAFNEAQYAQKVANHLNTDHTEYYCTPQEAKEILPTLPFFYDEPFGDSSAIPTILVSKLARKDVTVSLSADGGDEVFAGYERYPFLLKLDKNFKYMPKGVSKFLAQTMGLVSPAKMPILRDVPLLDLRYEKVRKLLENPSSTQLLKSMSCIIDNRGIQDLFSKSTTPLTSFFDENALSAQGILSQLLAKDYKTYMIDDILTKVDRATMSVSLEGREPFLDQNIVEWAAQLPDNLKINNGSKKYILKQIVHRHLPKTMMERPKMGFGVPIKTWFSNELSEYFSRYLNRALLDKQGILNATTVEFWLQSYNSGKTQYITHLWYALMFQMWYEKWMD